MTIGGVVMVNLSWGQVSAWRLARHHLLRRARREELVEVASDVGGIQAQVMSSAELALAARIDGLEASDVQDALWRDRKLVKVWAMRGTLHLLAAGDLPVVAAARSTLGYYTRASWLKYTGLTRDEFDAMNEGVRTTLSDEGMTREQLGEALAERTGMPHLRELVGSGWGTILKPAAMKGYLCFGPSIRQNVTFVHPARWLGEWEPVEPQEALKTMAMRFLTAYGPATIDDFAHWFGMELSGAKKVFRSPGVAGEIEEVDIEGLKAWAPVSAAGQIAAMEPLGAEPVVRLLGGFDPYVIALYRQSEYILPVEQWARVSRVAGWISPVVLVDGRMQGVWEYKKQRARIVATIDMFTAPTDAVKEGLQVEAKRLGDFMGAEMQLSYASSRP
jgi:hypothetical protein